MYEDVFGPNFYLAMTSNGQEETGHENYAIRRKEYSIQNDGPLRPWYPTPEEAIEDYQKHKDFLNQNVWHFDGILDGGELDGSWYVRFPEEVQTEQAVVELLQAIFDEYNKTAAVKARIWDDISEIPDELWQKYGMAAITDSEEWPDGQQAVFLHFMDVPELEPLSSALELGDGSEE